MKCDGHGGSVEKRWDPVWKVGCPNEAVKFDCEEGYYYKWCLFCWNIPNENDNRGEVVEVSKEEYIIHGVMDV